MLSHTRVQRQCVSSSSRKLQKPFSIIARTWTSEWCDISEVQVQGPSLRKVFYIYIYILFWNFVCIRNNLGEGVKNGWNPIQTGSHTKDHLVFQINEIQISTGYFQNWNDINVTLSLFLSLSRFIVCSALFIMGLGRGPIYSRIFL